MMPFLPLHVSAGNKVECPDTPALAVRNSRNFKVSRHISWPRNRARRTRMVDKSRDAREQTDSGQIIGKQLAKNIPGSID